MTVFFQPIGQAFFFGFMLEPSGEKQYFLNFSDDALAWVSIHVEDVGAEGCFEPEFCFLAFIEVKK